MGKLHEVLAVKDSLRKQAEATRGELINTFRKKVNHFTERLVTFQSTKEGVPDSQEEQLSLQTTVAKELEWISEKLAAAMDISYQNDKANTVAKADVALDNGNVLLKEVPATTLLELEKRVLEIQELVMAIQTLDPSKGFEQDPTREPGVYQARGRTAPRTEKQWSYKVMVEPTKEHPAQIKELNVDVVVGHLLTQEWSSLLTIKQKGDMLDRIEEVTRAVKKARARANEMEVSQNDSNKIGRQILDYVFKAKS